MKNGAVNTLAWIGAGRPRSDFISDADAARLAALGGVRFIETSGKKFTPEDVVRESQGMQATITTWATPAYTDEVLEGCTELEFYGRIGGSVRNVVGTSAWARGIPVVTAVDAQGVGLAEQTLMLMLAALHRLPHHILKQAGDGVIEHDGRNEGLAHGMLLERQVGLIGFGAIARHVARMLTVFRARVFACDPYVPDETLAEYGVRRTESVEALCGLVDVVSVHAARIPETKGILSREAIDRLRPGALVVNTAFADLMDLEAIEERVLAGDLYVAMDNLDVLGEDHREKIARIRTSKNCIITPVTFANTEGVALMGRQVVDELERFARGEPLEHAVKREVLATRG